MRAEPARSFATRESHADAWTLFWREQGADSRCIANLQPDARQALDAHWHGFAATLPAGARILDLGCGSGIVGRTLLAARGDLRVTGIDLAGVPPPGDPRLTLVPATAMEQLPFVLAAFDAAVSQFGFEYGEVGPAAATLARVLPAGAPISFIVHHGDSAVVRHGLIRRRIVDRLLGDTVREAFLAGRADPLEREIRAIRQGAPAEPIVDPVARALRVGIARNPAQRAALWNGVLAALAPERELLGALAAACVPEARLQRWLARLADWFEIGTATPLSRPSGEAIAWKIEGVSRKAANRP